MVITDNRIQNVLRTYSNQLQRSKLSRKLEADHPTPPDERVSISEEGRRRSIMERVAHQALEQAYPRWGDNSRTDELNEQ